ncbi:hypothetical protein PVA45_03505 [Entomospira entomophila]|uniref:Uncharacterized protein n=1 Tax=Entomospira entomophila TaxID=2719988 RepID=A0A968KSQ3_9SPIO|nr:hypothetical protein [Entomospira entomophilus]NIZ40577.1 hypothetical protein [Entomospira entomophilus]WDI36135.1 hypothetical protein PVA45_03505 [Entomospira entomophilus]
MSISKRREWIAEILSDIEMVLYERKQEFALCLVVLLAGEECIITGDAGVGKSFIRNILDQLQPFFSQFHLFEGEKEGMFIINIPELKEEESWYKLMTQRQDDLQLRLPEFSFIDALQESKQIALEESIVPVLMAMRVKERWSARQFRAYIQVLAISALYNQRELIGQDDLYLLQLLGVTHVGGYLQEDSSEIEKELINLEQEVDQHYHQQYLRKLKHFQLMVKGQELETCRFLYEGEESHMALSSYQQLLIHKERFIAVSFYQPMGYGLSPKQFKESFKLSDEFTLIDTHGHYYELLTEQATAVRRLSVLSKQYLQAQLDALLQKMLTAERKGDKVKNVFIVEEYAESMQQRTYDVELLERIRVLRSKI